MKKIFLFLFVSSLALVSSAQLGYRFSVVPGSPNKYATPYKEIKAVAYATPTTITPFSEDNTYNFAQLTGALTLNVGITKSYTGDRMYLMFNADGTARVVTFNTGFTSEGTLTVPISSYASVLFIFNGSAWQEISRRTSPIGSFSDGTVGAPGISFTSDLDNGLYRIRTNNIGVSAAGAKVLDIGTTGLGVVGVLNTGNGTASLPSLAFTSDLNSGVYRIGADSIGITSGGSKIVEVRSNGISVTGTLASSGLFSPATAINNSAGTVGNPAYSFTGQTDLGFYKASRTQLGVAVSGGLVAYFNANGLQTGNITELITDLGISFTKQTIQHRTATTYTVSAAVSAAELAKGLLTVTTATVTLTLPTATDIGTQIGAAAGTTFDFVVKNSSFDGLCTVAVGSGIVASGFPATNTLTLAYSPTIGIATFRLTFISATATTLTRTS
mgnify:CR=1 FL=1